jgi:hypothetical protein
VGWIEHLPALSTVLPLAQLDDVLKLDELRSFHGKKAREP